MDVYFTYYTYGCILNTSDAAACSKGLCPGYCLFTLAPSAVCKHVHVCLDCAHNRCTFEDWVLSFLIARARLTVVYLIQKWLNFSLYSSCGGIFQMHFFYYYLFNYRFLFNNYFILFYLFNNRFFFIMKQYTML